MIVAFSVTPPGVGADMGEYVADAVRVVHEPGLPNRTDAMFNDPSCAGSVSPWSSGRSP